MFRVGDPVMASTLGKPAREAAVVEVDPSDSSRFRVAFKDKRKKGGWRNKSELSAILRHTAGAAGSDDAASRQQQRPPKEAPPSADPATAPNKARKTTAKTTGTKSQRKTKRPTAKAGGATTAAEATVADAPGESDVVSSAPRRKRSAATAAAAAISSLSRSEHPKKKSARAKRGATAAVPTKTPRRKGWKRPKIVTPGSAEGRPEAALR